MKFPEAHIKLLDLKRDRDAAWFLWESGVESKSTCEDLDDCVELMTEMCLELRKKEIKRYSK
jgi:hypothetical protein